MNNDYLETIEHEMIHVEDYFSNHKIAFIEKMAKFHFLQNLKGTVENGKIYECVDKSKKQLVEIKKKGIEVRNNIEELSKDIYKTEKLLEEINNLEENEFKEIEELEKELQFLEGEIENNEEFVKTNSQFESICGEVKLKSDEIVNLNKKLTEINVVEIEIEYQKLKEEKDKLESKQKRLSVIQYEKFIEDLYFHYETYKLFFNKIIQMEIISTTVDNLIVVKLKNKILDVEIVISNGVLEELKVLKYDKKENLKIEELLKYYKRLGDPRYLICHIVFNLNN